MIYRGKVLRVVGASVLDVTLTLGFGISVQRRIGLLDSPEITGESLTKRAVHCLVILVGGKPILIDIPESDRTGRVTGIIYREVDDDKIDCFSAFISDMYGVVKSVVNVNAYLTWLSQKEFDVNDVKERIIHGRSK